MFLVLLHYVQPLEAIDRWIPDHVKFLDKYYARKVFVFSGRRNPRTGGVILVNAATLGEVEKIIKNDPFYINNLASYEIIEFTPSKYDDRFSCFVK